MKQNANETCEGQDSLYTQDDIWFSVGTALDTEHADEESTKDRLPTNKGKGTNYERCLTDDHYCADRRRDFGRRATGERGHEGIEDD